MDQTAFVQNVRLFWNQTFKTLVRVTKSFQEEINSILRSLTFNLLISEGIDENKIAEY